ncbi:MAG: hypothetical protein A2Y62_20905 [Candidatus Fischerbacteria bacterium RBG_13_37_8]|uniref:Fibronectin type-III domain-containing protein n=1 Tax=Candidatus Fischerbacteria bacterium RBG_13_37_8 TaxID=1817863 RepID=A0A1F5VF59_9BACT|nr:MAG: hypothetical protein A2Y62_20905 [Candidatus Fischerbacteria bacterium RBG_13_37_8]
MKTTIIKLFILSLSLFASFSFCFSHSNDNAQITKNPANYALLINDQQMDFKNWQIELKKSGYYATHWFPPTAAIYKLISPDELTLKPPVPASIYTTIAPAEITELSNVSDELRIAVHSFLALTDMETSAKDTLPIMAPLDVEKTDALVPPIQHYIPSGTCNATFLKRSGSEYLLGNISVNVILPESNGAIDPSTENWSLTRENQVTSAITTAMNFYTSSYNLHTNLTPSFTYHYYLGRINALAQTSYEPIVRPSDNMNEPGTGEGLWTNQIYNNLGYSGFTNRWLKGQEFNGDTRNNDGTDWAFTMFVVDSLNDSDGMFADSWFAYAWLGGPHSVMTYDNDGWTISQMNIVARHETGHTFYALDEYASSACTCTQVAGYVNYQNQNCENSCLFNGNCIMSSSTKQLAGVICSFTRGQIGWGDPDGDLVPDPVQIPPQTSIIPYAPDPTTNTMLTYFGQADIQTRPNQNLYNYQCDINILHIGAVYFRINGGGWMAAPACDGTYDSASECYTFTIGPLTPGLYTIDTMGADELGQADLTPASDTVTVLPAAPPGEPTMLKVMKNGANPNDLDLSWIPPGINCDQSTVFGVFRGLIPTVHGGGYDHTALVCYITTTSMTLPDPGPNTYLLVVAFSSTKEGSYGRTKTGVERPQSVAPCVPTQDFTPC